MKVTRKSTHDPLGEWNLFDAYMRWALLASEEVAGKQGLNIVLRNAKLEHFIDHYPPEAFEFGAGIKMYDYTALCIELLTFFGRAGRGSLVRIGRKSTQLALKLQSQQFGLDTLMSASKMLPAGLKQKAGLEANIVVWKTIYEQGGGHWQAHCDDRGDKWAYVVDTCLYCVNHEADAAICHVFTGHLIEASHWLLGKEYEIVETECHAMGAPACVWEISKKPKDES